MTRNGVAATATFGGTQSGNTAGGTFAVADADGNPVLAPGSFDGYTGLVFQSTNPGVGVVTAAITAPDTVGTDYPFSVTCAKGATGPFTIALSSVANGGELSASQLSGLALTYPKFTTVADSYTCTNGVLTTQVTGYIPIL